MVRRVLFCLVTAVLAAPYMVLAQGDQAVQVKTADQPPESHDFGVTTYLRATERAEYTYDPGKQLVFGLSLEKALPYGLSAIVTQGITYRSEPYEEMRGTDTEIELNRNIWRFGSTGLEINGGITGSLGHSKVSTDQGLKGTATPNISLDFIPSLFFSMALGLSSTIYFFDDTFDRFGEANTRYDRTASFSISGKYRGFSLGSTFALHENIMYEGWENQYAFSSRISTGYTYNDYHFSLGMESTDNQLRDGRNNNFRPFDDEISSYFVGVTKKISKTLF